MFWKNVFFSSTKIQKIEKNRNKTRDINTPPNVWWWRDRDDDDDESEMPR
jgi:hypothetical protein